MILRFLITLALLLPIIFNSADAIAEIKVKKVKGRRAIIALPVGHEVKPGDTLYADESNELTLNSNEQSGATKPLRPMSIGVEAMYDSGESKAIVNGNGTDSSKSTKVRANAFFGFNFRTVELGPKVYYEKEDDGTSIITAFSVGGFVEYNFIDNTPDASFVPSVGFDFGVGKGEISGNGLTISGTNLSYSFYLSTKVFLRPHFALVPKIGRNFSDTKFESNPTNLQKIDGANNQFSLSLVGYF